MKDRKLFILVGPPGSGKGTQSELLTKELNINYYSVGEILRNEVANKTKLGKEVVPFLKAGTLAPDDLIARIMFNKLKNSRKSLIFDGFPRNLKQAKLLDEEVKQLEISKVVIEIDLPVSKIIERISGRRYCVCGKTYHLKYKPTKIKGVCDKCGKKLKVRSDAKPEVVKERIKIYNKKTRPIINFYKDNNGYVYRHIDGDQAIPKVHDDIRKIIDKINDKIKKPGRNKTS